MSKTVRIIPPTIERYTAAPIDNPRKRRVAAYARVSTDSDEQKTSYDAQVDYYTKYIKEKNVCFEQGSGRVASVPIDIVEDVIGVELKLSRRVA